MIFRQFLFVPSRRQVINEDDYLSVDQEGNQIVLTLKDSEVKFKEKNFTSAIDKVFKSESQFIPGSIVKVAIFSEKDAMVADGTNTAETLAKLTYKNFNFRKQDNLPVDVEMIGQLKPHIQQGEYRGFFSDHYDEEQNLLQFYCNLKGTTDSKVHSENGLNYFVGNMITKIELGQLLGKPFIKVSYVNINRQTGEIGENIVHKGIYNPQKIGSQFNLRYLSLIQSNLKKMKMCV